MKTRERMRNVRRLPCIPIIIAPPRLLAELTLLELLRPAGTLVVRTAFPARRLIPTIRTLRAIALALTPILTLTTTLAIAPVFAITAALIETRRSLEIPFREIARTAGTLIIGTAFPARRLIPTVRTLRAKPLAVTLLRTLTWRALFAPVTFLRTLARRPLLTPVALRPPLRTRRPVRIPRRLVVRIPRSIEIRTPWPVSI